MRRGWWRRAGFVPAAAAAATTLAIPTKKRRNLVACDTILPPNDPTKFVIHGQGGKPMSLSEAQTHKATLDPQWDIVDDDNIDDNDNAEKTMTTTTPSALVRTFVHHDFYQGGKFLQQLAAVALVHNHYPSLTLERVVHKKQWRVVSTVRCRTTVLKGLSTNDFFLAAMIDVEIQRPELKQLLRLEEEEKDSSSKSTTQ